MNTEYDVIIIGAGVAGMSAALNCRRAEKSVLLLESECIGGQVATSPKVENYPTKQQIAGSDLADEIFNQVMEWGAEFDLDGVESVSRLDDGSFEVKCQYNTHTAKSIIIATGAHHRTMGIDREEELVGKGVSYCAICDGAFYSGEDVVVIGDGNTALQYSNLLAGYCKSVHICTLFDKPARHKVDIKVDYNGLEVPDEFIVGYGLDYAEIYRNYPEISVLKPSVYED